MTVLQVLKNIFCLSGGMIKHVKFLEDGITVNSQRVTVRYTLKEGDVLEVKTDDSHLESDILPVELPLRIAYEDGELVVPDKPSDMPTHPSCGHYTDTVANALAHRYKDDGVFVFRPINRLDRDTSGLLIVARNRIAAGRLTSSMQKKKIRKKYIAVLDGVLEGDGGRIETYMRRTAESIIVREVCEKEEGADYALTEYKVLKRGVDHTLVLAEPLTGRTHQLRVHFASLGHPITGDTLYGKTSEDISRQALHAGYLAFEHPSTGNIIRVRSALHGDMAELVEKYFNTSDVEYDI